VSGAITRPRIVAAVVVVLALLGLVVALSADTGSTDAAKGKGANATSSTGAGGAAGSDGGSTADGGTAGTDGAPVDGAGGTDSATQPPLPVEATVIGTTGLHAGDEVTVTVTADDGSKVYAVEMRQCEAGAVIHNDGDMRPSVAGKCAQGAISPGADAYKIVPSEGDRTAVTATYRVGVGSNTFQREDGSMDTVTCDHDHPCVLAVKYQIPDGFGFRTYPLTFA
jgi:hypothetical protein